MDKNTTTKDSLTKPTDEFNNLIFNPLVILSVFFIIILYFSFSLGNNDSTQGFVFGDTSSLTSNSNNSTLLNIVLGIIIFYMLIKFIEYIYNIDLSTKIYDVFTNTPKIDINIDNNSSTNSSTGSSTGSSTSSNYLDSNGNYNSLLLDVLDKKKQVFNIPGNKYDYDSAKALCKAYNSELATYNQVEESYESGGEWCNYGWSEGQMALFPTQQTTYNNLQKIEGHEHDCGRPGINGGYIANPNINFGVNCYGVKPSITQEESDLMKTMTPYPETAKDKAFQAEVDSLKNKITEILVSPFNYKSWTQV
jgi:hypothetical protein